MLAEELEIGVAARAAAAWAVPVAVCPAGAGRVLGGEVDGSVDDVATALSVGVGALVVVVPAHAPAKTATAAVTTAPNKALCQRSRSRRRWLFMQRLLVRKSKSAVRSVLQQKLPRVLGCTGGAQDQVAGVARALQQGGARG